MAVDNVILGKDVVYSTDCNVTGLNNNRLVVAPSGGGKTMSIGEPILLEANHSSYIVTLTKRKLVAKYKPLLERRGYKVQDLNFVHPEKSDISYDPLQYVRTAADITFLGEAIVMADKRKEKSNADPYWDKAAISLHSALTAYILITKKNATYADVLDLFDQLEFSDNGGIVKTSLDDKFETLAEKAPLCFAVNCWKTFHQLPIRTASCVYSTLNCVLDTIFSAELRKMMRKKNKVNFEKLASEKTVLFVSTSPVNPSLHCFVNTFYSTVFKQLFEFGERCADGKLPIPVHVLCDDFATGGKILNFPELISIFREKQISVTLLLQSESQLEAMYGSSATTIINNCDTYIFMGTNDLKTAQSVSIKMNAPLEDILWMPIGQEIIFRRGQRPIMTQRYNILENELYRKVTKQYERTIAKNNKLEHQIA